MRRSASTREKAALRMRLTRLDLLRGVAALSVAVFHYTGFLMLPGQVASDVSDQPLRWLLWPFYLYGGAAVQFFWLLSGIVFQRVYGGRNVREFWLRRFARLYPLHFVTLLIMAALNAANLFLFNEALLPTNDL